MRVASDAKTRTSLLEASFVQVVDLTPEGVESLAAQGVTRLVVAPGSADPQQQRDELSAFAAVLPGLSGLSPRLRPPSQTITPSFATSS
jgi:hypothetical protein